VLKETEWTLGCFILIVSQAKKAISSTEGMKMSVELHRDEMNQ